MLNIKKISTDHVLMEFPCINFISCENKMMLATENAVHTLGRTRGPTALRFFFYYRHKLTIENTAKRYTQNFLNILLHYWKGIVMVLKLFWKFITWLVITKKIGREVWKTQNQITQDRLSVPMPFAFEAMWGIYTEKKSQWLPVQDRSAKD